MADPKAEATFNKNDKSSILDDDIGKEILSTWDLISVTEDTGDFKLEPMGKSKKKDFNFGKMDMDFNLSGDFGKLSSFKMDMSDLDFSFPPNKNKKATETTERDSSRVNIQGKEDRFNFSFDFDNFDIDAALSKPDTLSSKQKEIQNHFTDKTDIEASDVQDIEVTIADPLKNPKKGQTSETVEAVQVQVLANTRDTLTTGNHSLRYDTSVDIALQPGAETESNKAVHDARENAVDRSCLPVDQPIIQEHNDHSMLSNLGAGSMMEPPEKGCYSGRIVNAKVGGEKSICYENASDAVQPKSPEFVLPQIAEHLEGNTSNNKILSDSNDICIEELVGPGPDHGGSPKIVQSKILELSQDNNDVNGVASNTSADVKESSDEVSNSYDASVVSAVKIQHGAMKTQLSPLSSREPVITKSLPGKEKESKLVRLKFLGKSGEADNPNHESSVFIKPKSSNVIATRSDCPPQTREAIARENPTGLAAEGGFVSHKKITKGDHTLLRNQTTLITPKENSLCIISLSKSVEMANRNESQKSDKANLISTTDCSQSVRYISTGKDKSLPLKSVTRNLGLTDLKSSCSRWAAEKKLQSISATTNEIKSFKDLKQKFVEDVTPKVAVLSLTEKQKPELPTLKRKQAPTVGLVHEIPLKRLSQSPKNIRCWLNVDVPKILKSDAPGQMNSSVLDIPSEINDFEMVEKAAAYGKDLDDLCNMLKKKNEEAKELLVRAVVNNNNLVLLNHPMHDEKIRSVQKLANRLMALEIVPHPR